MLEFIDGDELDETAAAGASARERNRAALGAAAGAAPLLKTGSSAPAAMGEALKGGAKTGSAAPVAMGETSKGKPKKEEEDQRRQPIAQTRARDALMFAVTAHEVGGGGGEVRVDGITLDAIAACLGPGGATRADALTPEPARSPRRGRRSCSASRG